MEVVQKMESVESDCPIDNSVSSELMINGEKSDNGSETGPVEENKEELEGNEWMDILGNGQLKKKVLTPGVENSRPQKPDVCELKIIGKLEDGTVVENVESITINMGDNDVIQGLDFALALMDKGEVAEIVVSPRFAYGSLGRSPDIPPDATVIYTVSLLNVTPEPPVATLTLPERVVIGLRKKERGNWWYSRNEHTLAIHCYRRALDYFDDAETPGTPSEEEVKSLLEEKLKTYNNLGASQIKINAYDSALISCNHVLDCQPENVKALYRKSQILKVSGDLNESVEVIRKALLVEPHNKSLQMELSALLATQRKENNKQRDLYRKMMGNNVQQDRSSEKLRSTPAKSTLKWVAALTVTVAVIGVVAAKYKYQ